MIDLLHTTEVLSLTHKFPMVQPSVSDTLGRYFGSESSR